MESNVRKNDELGLNVYVRGRMAIEAEDMECDFGIQNGDYWGWYPRTGGLVLVEFKSGSLTLDGRRLNRAPARKPIDPQLVLGRTLTRALDSQLHHDGKWIVAFSAPKPMQMLGPQLILRAEYARMFRLFVDQDGDPAFTCECDIDDFGDNRGVDFYEQRLDSWLELSEQAWQRWNHHMRSTIDKSSQRALYYRRALGERPPSALQGAA